MAEGLDISVRFDRPEVDPDNTRVVHAAVRIVAPPATDEVKRAPLDLVACVDVSGSMQGVKLHRAKDSLRKLVGQLSAGDRLGIVAFESEPHAIFASATMTAENKELAREAIDRLRPMGSTNMSGGLAASLAMLTAPRAEASRENVLRRVLLFTDGHANSGLIEGDIAGWAALIRENARRISVSWFGYGEDHNAGFLSALADVSRGNYYRAENEDAIIDAFAREIGGLLSTVAREVRLRVRPVGGAGPLTLLNDEPVRADGEWLIVDLPDLYAEEQRWVVFEVPLHDGALRAQREQREERRLIELEVGWIWSATAKPDSIALSGSAALVNGSPAIGEDGEVVEQVAILKAAQLQRRAADLAHRGEFGQARDLVLQAAHLLGQAEGRRARALERALQEAAAFYGDAESYRLNRNRLFSVQRSMSKMRSSGSAFDAYFDSASQSRMVATFQGGGSEPRPGGESSSGGPRSKRRSPTKH